MSDEIEIKLVDHVGKTRSGKEVDHGQWIVSADGQQIGYMQKKPGAFLACIVSMDEDQKQRIEQAVAAKLGQPIGGVVTQPEPEAEDEDE